MFTNRLNSRMFFALFNTLFILALFFGNAASPTDVDAASSISAQTDSISGEPITAHLQTVELPKQSKLQVVTFAPPADACTDSCAQTQTDAIAWCNANFDPVASCGGDAACEAEITAQLDSCIADANTAYSACTASCATPPSCTDSCAATQTDAIAACYANFDPLIICGGDPACEADMTAALDSCITDANTAYSACTALCAVPPDGDGDGVADSIDNCPLAANADQMDVDGDGLGDVCDPFPFDPYNLVDSDADTFPDDSDNCPSAYNPDQSDMDADGLGDVCDPFPLDSSNLDIDGDGISESADNCRLVANTDQRNTDGDAFGDACDPFPLDPTNLDSDSDGRSDSVDNCPLDANTDQSNMDGDAFGDVCDPFPLDSSNLDSDSDGISDSVDNCPLDANTDQSNMDGDGLGDVCDPTPNGLLEQTITVTISAPTSAIADDEFTVEATASSGLPVLYRSAGECSNVDGAFTMDSGSGDCIVTYDQLGDANYNPATQVIETVTGINSAPIITEGESINMTMSEDGDPIPFALRLNATDADNDELIWSISSPASHGTAAINPKSRCEAGKKEAGKEEDGKVGATITSCQDFEYTPTTGYFGTDSFDVEVSDGDLTDTITVNVTIERTNTSVVTLLDSQGNGLEGATAQYYSGGWHNIPGSTDADGILSYDGLGLSGNLTFRISYANASIQKQQNITDNPEVIFQTELVNMQLLASDGSSELSGDAQYYSNGWRTFGSGSTSTSMELLPLNYTFRVSYGGASIQKQQNIGNDPAVVFQTELVSMQLLASDGTTELTGTGQYYANGWKTFGSGSTSTTMELLPVNYTFRVSYSGASIQKQQDVNSDAAVLFQTELVSMQLLTSDGTTELTGTGQYYANGWKTFGSGSTSATMELLPVNYTFRVFYGGASIQKQQNVSSDPAVVFQTKLVTMKLLASDGTTELSGTGQYYANGWKTFSNGSTTTTMELLPVNYTFRVSYGGANVQKQQDVNTDQLVIFQTGQVHSNSAAATQYYANGWKTFVQDMELLPGSYAFKFNDGTPQTTYTLIVGSVNNIH